MARLARAVAPGYPHHVTQRGNRHQQTFFGDDDYRAYVDLLARWAKAYEARVWGWRLMPNHVHLILVPPGEAALRLRRHERTGRPLGTPDFVEQVGNLLGRDLLAKKRGPKPQAKGS